MLECTTNRHARVAQRWSTSLPRRGSRVRFPSRALKKVSCRILFLLLFLWAAPVPALPHVPPPAFLLPHFSAGFRSAPFFCHFPAFQGYRLPLSFSCTRPAPFLPLPTGTDDHFSSPIPGRRFIFRFPRVQMTTFPLLYPAIVLFSASHGYRRPLFLSCTRPAPSSPQTAQKFDIWVKRLGSSYPSVSAKIRFSVSVGMSCFK